MTHKPQRQCGTCTACCEGWIRATINSSTKLYPGHSCPHLSSTGCSIYARRPTNPCAVYLCGWMQTGSPLPEWMRPDQGGAIIYLSKLNWNNLQVDVAVPTGEQIPQATLDWLIAFSGQHKRPLIFMTQLMKDGQYINKQSMTGVGPPAFQQQLVEWSRNGETVI